MSESTSVNDPTITGPADAAAQHRPGATDGAAAPAPRKRKVKRATADGTAAVEAGTAADTDVKRAPRPRVVTPIPVMAGTPSGGNGEVVRTERVSIVQGGADRVDAGSISITQGGIGEATAGSVDIRQGGIARLEAEDVHVAQGGIALARGDRISVELGGIGAALANDLRVTQGAVGSMLARRVTIEQGLVRTLIAQEVHFERPGGVLVMLAARVTGDVRPVLDWRGALAFGAAFGVIVGLFRGRRRES